MTVAHLFAGIPVTDRDMAVSWYERLTGRPPDLIPNEQEAAWRLTETGWIFILVDPARAGTGLHTLLVENLDTCIAELAGRCIETGPVQILGTAARRAIVTDPDGNQLALGQPLG